MGCVNSAPLNITTMKQRVIKQIMCLYPKLIRNRKYIPNKKNGGKPPEIKDPRTEFVAVGCGKCMECRRQKTREWQLRLNSEIEDNKNGQFVTLSFSDEAIYELQEIAKNENPKLEGYELDNKSATIAVRRFLERWRAETGKSVKHWLVTELGSKETERIHLHGIIFTDKPKLITEKWKYGFTYIGEFVNTKTIRYIAKYIHKQDKIHPNYTPVILTSPGIGSNYTKSRWAELNKFKGDKTQEYTYNRAGFRMAIPPYLRNKIYTDEEREQLWINKLDKMERYVNGIKVDVSKNMDEYYKVLEDQQMLNRKLGYGDNTKDWSKIRYEQQQRQLKNMQRITKLKEKENGNTRRIKGKNKKDN
ncbi:MAG: replication initiator protein [Microviridae sp.]|nr:MAG: replication initiator protein [Microviridae sp.]